LINGLAVRGLVFIKDGAQVRETASTQYGIENGLVSTQSLLASLQQKSRAAL
jgi:hypothetical protein